MRRKTRRTGGGDAGTGGGGRDLCRMGVGVIAGGLMFVGQAKAAPLVNESFESSPSALFGGFNSYAYNQNYTGTSVPPDAGDRYFTGTSGLVSQTHTGTVGLAGAVPTSAIDAGLGRYDLSAYFSTYQDQNDFSEVRLQFTNGSGANVGSPVSIGGQDFVTALDTEPNADGLAGYRPWAQDLASGSVPVGARSAVLTIFTQRQAGTAADGYLDLVSLDVTEVPEPGVAGVAAFAAAMIGLRRRRRSPQSP